MDLRQAVFNDLPLLGKIRETAIMAQPETFWSNAEKQIAANFWQQMDIHQNFSDHKTFVFYNNAKASGFVSWKNSYLAYLFILPELQGGGIGKNLINFACENIAKKHNHVWLLAHPYSENFYIKNGFKKMAETENPFGTKPLHKFIKYF